MAEQKNKNKRNIQSNVTTFTKEMLIYNIIIILSSIEICSKTKQIVYTF